MKKRRSNGDGGLVKPSLLTLLINLVSLNGKTPKWLGLGKAPSKNLTQVI